MFRGTVVDTANRSLQPALHRLAVLVRAPVVAVSDADGQVRPEGVQGLLRDDRRLLSCLVVTVDGVDPESVETRRGRGPEQTWWSVCRTIGDAIPDPTVYLERTRTLTDRGLVERCRLVSHAQHVVVTTVGLAVATDLANLQAIKVGNSGEQVAWDTTPTGVGLIGDAVEVACTPPPNATDTDTSPAAMHWDVRLEPGATWTLDVVVDDRVEDAGPFSSPGDVDPPWRRPHVAARDPDLAAVVDRGLDDLQSMLLADGDDVFVAAGAPWFLTLFGRDSLWTARMMLPLGTDLALSTLRTLARRQGTRTDRSTEEQPGKILHEVRRDTHDLGNGHVLPAQYFGTVDATPLWIVLLVDAWRWGADLDTVHSLLPPLRAALEWLQHAAAAGDGLLRYVDESGTGLSNQGWKDSEDSIQFADGRLATPPVALIECQAYAHEAAMGAADLLDALGQVGGEELRHWARDLARRVRASYWQVDGHDTYLAVALDGDDRPVDSVTSNGGHALGTGLLTAAEAADVAATMVAPSLTCPYGLRTLTTDSPRFAPLSYHGGTVWPHDTAIVATGLAREGFLNEATDLALGLVAVGPAFDHRLPELFGVTRESPRPLAYPAACSPQAWAAAAPIGALVAVLGLRADLPNHRLTVPPRVDPRLAGLQLRGITIGGGRLHLEVDDDGTLCVTTEGSDVEVVQLLPGTRPGLD